MTAALERMAKPARMCSGGKLELRGSEGGESASNHVPKHGRELHKGVLKDACALNTPEHTGTHT